MNNLLLEVEGPIAVLTINRPKALNALNSETLTELNEVLTEIEGRDDIDWRESISRKTGL